VSYAGLRRRGRLDQSGRDETRHLEPLQRTIDCGRSPAEEMLEKFRGPWKETVEPAYDEYAF
jgi:glutamate--cysteine ligase